MHEPEEIVTPEEQAAYAAAHGGARHPALPKEDPQQYPVKVDSKALWCCDIDCKKDADFAIYYGSADHQNTHACTDHVGSLLSWHPSDPEPEMYLVYPIASEPFTEQREEVPLEPQVIVAESTHTGMLDHSIAEHVHQNRETLR